ncbi:MAG: segregation and condensation protein A [Rhizobiaceae bacterium]
MGKDINNPDLLTIVQSDDWSNERPERAVTDPQLTVDVSGFEGPLDLLLELSRRQKVDLSKISILALAEQYLEFIEDVRKLRIELAADYLVMAAWLAFLKSKLLIPAEETGDGELSGEEMAAQLAFRLRRLEAMREAGTRLIGRNRLGRDFFVRGVPEPIKVDTQKKFNATLYDLLSAYATQRQRASTSHVTIAKREVWSLQEAREILLNMIGDFGEWTCLDDFLIPYIPTPELRNSARASSFAASLELAREGKLTLRQEEPFTPLYMKSKTSRPDVQSETGRN